MLLRGGQGMRALALAVVLAGCAPEPYCIAPAPGGYVVRCDSGLRAECPGLEGQRVPCDEDGVPFCENGEEPYCEEIPED